MIYAFRFTYDVHDVSFYLCCSLYVKRNAPWLLLYYETVRNEFRSGLYSVLPRKHNRNLGKSRTISSGIRSEQYHNTCPDLNEPIHNPSCEFK